eukprot:1157277-Pelagomonas_calceolata.AAC.2
MSTSKADVPETGMQGVIVAWPDKGLAERNPAFIRRTTTHLALDAILPLYCCTPQMQGSAQLQAPICLGCVSLARISCAVPTQP